MGVIFISQFPFHVALPLKQINPKNIKPMYVHNRIIKTYKKAIFNVTLVKVIDMGTFLPNFLSLFPELSL